MPDPTRSARYWGAVLVCACIAVGGALAPRAPVPADAPARRAVPGEEEMLRLFEKAVSERPLVRHLSLLFAGAVVAGLLIDVKVAARLPGRRLAPAGTPGEGWGIGEVLKAALLFLSVFLALQALAPLFRRLFGGPSEVTLQVAFQFLAELAAVAYILVSVRPGPRGPLAGLGLGAGRPLPAAWAGVKAYAGFLPVLLCLVVISRIAAERTGVAVEPQAPLGLFFADLSGPALVFLAAFVAVIGPVFEEIFFRGFAYQAVRRRWGRLPAVLLTALLFSALHANAAVFLPILGLGVVLASVFETTGSLVAPIAVHLCQNGAAVAAALLLRSIASP